MARRSVTTNLFKLNESFKSLDDVNKKIKNKIYEEPFRPPARLLKQMEDLSDHEKNFYYKWITDNKKFETLIAPDLSTGELNVPINYLVESARLEYSAKITNKNDVILPKEDRIRETDVEIIFFEYNNKVYGTIWASEYYSLLRAKKLIGMNNLEVVIPEYKLEPDIFNWLFYMYSSHEGVLTEGVKVKNIGGFTGNIIDEHSIFKGTSDQTSDLIITKAFISNGELIREVIARIKDSHIDITFLINSDSVATINLAQSSVEALFNGEKKEIFISIYLYVYILPKLQALYKKNSKLFLDVEKKSFSKRIGIDVINSIIKKNGIKLEDLFDISASTIKQVSNN